jgi:hypothetical protein
MDRSWHSWAEQQQYMTAAQVNMATAVIGDGNMAQNENRTKFPGQK